MDQKLVVLKLVLDAVGVPASIRSIDDRKRVQKAVYLAQLADIDLGYRFGWYLMGPYSPTLTRDYYSLAEAIASGERDYKNFQLNPASTKGLKSITRLMRPPSSWSLSPENWLELVASTHFLRNVRQLTYPQLKRVLKEKKPTLFPFVDMARKALDNSGQW